MLPEGNLMHSSHNSILTALGVVAVVATIIGTAKFFFDDTPMFYFLTGTTFGIIITIVLSELLERFSKKPAQQETLQQSNTTKRSQRPT